jgi:phage shock protein A
MSLPHRLRELYLAKTRAARAAAGNAPEAAGEALARYRELLAQAGQAVADLAASGRRLNRRIHRFRDSADGLRAQARRQFAAGREDLARETLIRRSAVLSDIDELQRRQAAMQAEQDSLAAGLRRLQATAEALRNRGDSLRTGVGLADAEARIGEALAGITEEMAEVGRILRRAKATAAQVDARTGTRGDTDDSRVADSGTDAGAGFGPLGDSDTLQEQLDEVNTRREVEEELARMKRMRASGPRSPRRGS